MTDPFQHAFNAFVSGRFKETEKTCKEILKRQPGAHQVLHLLALTEKRRGKQKLAIKTFNKALQLAPKTAMYWNNLGETHREMGDTGSAIACYRKAIEHRPGYAEAHSNWGIALKAAADYSGAERQLLQAIEANPQLVNAHFNLGVLYLDQGYSERARPAFEQVLNLDPDNADAHVNLGCLNRAADRLEAAQSHYLRAIGIDPTHVEAQLNLGNLYYQGKRYREAVRHCAKAAALSPDNLNAWLGLGHAHNEAGHHQDAFAAFERAAAIDPASLEALLGMSGARLGSGDKQDALRILQQASPIIGEDPRLHKQLAKTYLAGGDRAAAEAAARRCLTLQPDDVGAYQLIVQCKSFQDRGDRDLRNMIDLYLHDGTSAEQRCLLAFNIAKALGGSGDYDSAFDYLEQGNRLQRKSFDFDIDDARRQMEAFGNLCDGARVDPSVAAANDDDRPIFIVGMPRSGSSLVEQILASHPLVAGAGELEDLRRLLMRQCRVERQEMLPPKLAGLRADDYRQIGEAYVAALRRRFPETPRVTDKMPSNFLYLGIIRLALPKAKIIHCLRDPVATCLSIYEHKFAGQHPYAYDLTELGQYYRLYTGYMARWQRLLGDALYTVHYEEMVAHQERETRALLNYCGLDFDADCLTFFHTDRAVLTASVSQVRNPIYNSSIARWRHYRHRLGPLLEALDIAD